MIKQAADLVYTFRFLKLLVTDFDKTKAYELGLIDETGKRLKKSETKEEKDAYTPFHRLVFNIKKVLNKTGAGKLASYASALYLIKEKYGVNIEKALPHANVIAGDFIAESTTWFLLESGELAPGVYRILSDKVVNESCQDVVKENDKIRVENGWPIGDVYGMNIYEAIHIKSNQKIYITLGEIRK